MSLKLKAKNSLFYLLDKLPEDLGFHYYHYFQEKFGGLSLDSRIKVNYPFFKTLEKFAEDLEFDLKNKRILEIGSGWLPIMPYYFKYLGGASEIITVDLNKHYKAEAVEEFNQFFSKKYGIEVKGEGQFALPQEVIYYPKTNLLELQDLEADLIFSRFVLEHVYPQDMMQMHHKFKSELMPGSYIIHFISPSDHRAYDDKDLSLQDFLQFSAEQWDKKQTKFDYHNRMRLPQYLDLFKKAGLEIVYLNYDVPPEGSIQHKKFKEVQLHPDFQGFSEEELMAGSIQVVLKI